MSDIDNHLTYIQSLEARIAKLELVVSGLVGRDCTPIKGDAMSIVRMTAKRYGTKEALLLGPSRQYRLVRPRWSAMYILSDVMRVEQIEIARIFNRSHNSVQYAVSEVRRLIKERSGDFHIIERLVCDVKRALLAADLVGDAA